MANEKGKRNPRCYLDISVGGEVEGRVVVELFVDVVPRTAENFRALCTGHLGLSPLSSRPLHFKGVPFHRIIKGLMIQGGDFTAHNGTGGESIYGKTFEDESFELMHERKGLLSMVNFGPNTNGSQFFITMTRTPHLDNKHVIFGKVVKGMGVVRSLEYTPTDDQDRPLDEILIADCGEIPDGKDDGVAGFFKDGDIYPDWPADLNEQPKECDWWVAAVESSKCFGNESYKKGDYKMALRKYRKAMRYLDNFWEKEDINEEKTNYLRTMNSHILTNSSACKLKIGDAKGALLDAEYAIRYGGDNVKALFRQGQAHLALNNIDDAVECLSKALKIEPNDAAIRRELTVVNKKITERKDKEKKSCQKMFQ